MPFNVYNAYVKNGFHILKFLIYLLLKLNRECYISVIIFLGHKKQLLYLNYPNFVECGSISLWFELFPETLKELNQLSHHAKQFCAMVFIKSSFIYDFREKFGRP